MSLPSDALRRAMRYGEWLTEGAFFTEFSEKRDGKPWHVIDQLPRVKGKSILSAPYIEIFRAVDWGFSGNPGVCLFLAALHDGTLIVFDEYVFKQTLPRDAAKEIIRRSEGLKVRYTVADPAVWAEHEGPSIAEHFSDAGLPMIEGDRQRKSGWVTVHKWLMDTVNDGTGERPKLQIYRPNCPLLIRSLPAMQIDEKDPEDCKTRGVEDDAPDALRYALTSRPSASRMPTVDPATAWMFREMHKSRVMGTRLGTEATHR